ncbi:MAG: hypothetical protein HUU54_12315 [Ignavibacteriaceae bacterium]|nr:hypothetical protein [Ignavibacteriaceae bacterium]
MGILAIKRKNLETRRTAQASPANTYARMVIRESIVLLNIDDPGAESVLNYLSYKVKAAAVIIITSLRVFGQL